MQMNDLVKTVAVGLSVTALSAAAANLTPEEKAAREKRDARVKELQKVQSTCNMDWSYNNSYMRAYYCPTSIGLKEAVSEEEHAAMVPRYLAATKELAEILPGDSARQLDYAGLLFYLGRHEEAEKIYVAELAKLEAQKKPDKERIGRGMLSLAECKFGRGDRDGAIAVLEDLAKRGYNFGRRGSPSGSASASLECLTGELNDGWKLPRFTGAKAFPTAQKAEYAETFAPLKSVTVKTDGIDGDDPRFALFDAKLRRLGVAVSHPGFFGSVFGGSDGYVLSVEVRDAVPEFAALKQFQQDEAYVLETTKEGAKLTAQSRQGVLWGLVTFVQMIDPKAVALREGRVVDWPAARERGYLSEFWPGGFEYAVMCKFNSVTFQSHPSRGNHLTPLADMSERTVTRLFVSCGLTVYYNINDVTMYPNMPLSSPRTLKLQADICRRFAAMGAGVYYPYDDERFPMNEQDRAKYTYARNIDADHIQRLYETVTADYPDFKLIFCPPFYWGPDSSAEGYGEDREEYLKTLRKLDPKIQLYWTGPMVKSFDMTRRQVKWFTDLTGHKPSIFQNGTDTHRYLVNYLADDFDFVAWHYPEFYDDIVAFHANSHLPCDTARNTSFADALWNPGAYVPMTAAKRGTDMLFGDGVFDILRPGRDALAYFDKYADRRRVPIDILNEKPEGLQAKLTLAKDCLKRAAEIDPKVVWVSHYSEATRWNNEILALAKNPPDVFSQFKNDILKAERQAKEEVGVDPAKGDILLTAASLGGGQFLVYQYTSRAGVIEEFAHPVLPRLVRCLRGSKVTSANATGFHFECDPFPPTGDYEMYICGMDDEAERQNTLRISLNGKVISEAPLGFPDHAGYSVKKVVIPFAAMKRHNDVTILNATPGSNPRGTPWIMINYIVLKKAPKR